MSFDASLHLALSADLAAIDAFSEVPAASYKPIARRHAASLKADGFTGGHLWCADARWTRDREAVAALRRESSAAGLKLSCAADPLRPQDALAALDLGLDGTVLSTLHTGFGPETVRTPGWKALLRGLAARRKPVFVTTAYGTPALYRHDSLPVLAAALEAAPGLSFTALHGGGHRFRELVLLADAHPRLLIDLSFTVLWYAGSALEADWAWGMRKLGPRRFVFGSDAPFASRARTLAAFERLGREAGWSVAARREARSGGARAFQRNP